MTERDTTACEIVGREFNYDAVAGEDANVVLSHLAGKMTEDGVPILQLDGEHRIGQRIDNSTVDGDRIRILMARPFDDGRGRCRRADRPRWLTVGGFLCQTVAPLVATKST